MNKDSISPNKSNLKRYCFCNKVIGVNALAAAMVALEAGWGIMQAILPINFYILMAIVLPVINAALRVLTHKSD